MKAPALLLAALLSVTAFAPAQCNIQGTVIDSFSGQSLPKTRVFVEEEGSASVPPIRHIAGPNGEFCFEHLEPGKYMLSAARTGYLDAEYGAKLSDGLSLVLDTLGGKQWQSLIIKMIPQAVISGNVVDGDGDPVAKANVTLLKRGWKDGKIGATDVQQTIADEKGQFRISDLAAGTYYLNAGPEYKGHPSIVREHLDPHGQPFHDAEALTYYRASLSLRAAAPITVKAGQEISGLTIILQKTALRHVSGRVAAGWNGSEAPLLWLTREDENGGEAVVDIRPQKDGSFRVESLLPGEYLLETMSPDDANTKARMSVDLTERDVDDVVVEPLQTLNFQFVIRADHGAADVKPQGEDIFLFDSKADNGYTARRDANGIFRFTGVVPGVYSIRILNKDDFFIKRVILDDETQNEPTIDLRHAQPKQLEAVLSTNFASLSGRLAVDHPVTSAVTVVLQDETEQHQGEPELAAVDTNGDFEWDSIPPGKYRLYAFEDFDEDFWGSPEVAAILAGKSVVLELFEGQERHVKVPLISAREFQDALRKAGY